MINLHLTKITKLFDLENLELYGTSSMVTIVNGNLIYVVHCRPSFRKSSIGRGGAGDCVCVHSSSGASFHMGGFHQAPLPMGCGRH